VPFWTSPSRLVPINTDSIAQGRRDLDDRRRCRCRGFADRYGPCQHEAQSYGRGRWTRERGTAGGLNVLRTRNGEGPEAPRRAAAAFGVPATRLVPAPGAGGIRARVRTGPRLFRCRSSARMNRPRTRDEGLSRRRKSRRAQCALSYRRHLFPVCCTRRMAYSCCAQVQGHCRWRGSVQPGSIRAVE
jgi:hypothetical protein